MIDNIQRLDISHDALFERPAFELMREFPAIIKEFYGELGTKFTVNPIHTTINSTNNFGELVVRIGLFNNVASVEIKADKLSANLPTIMTRDAVQLAKDTISLSHKALSKALPNTTIASSSFDLNMWIALEGGASAAEEILSNYSEPAKPIDASAWGALTARNGLRLLTRNDVEGWSLTIFGDPSLVQGSHLFLSVELAFVREGIKSADQQIEIIESKLQIMLRTLGVNVQVGAHGNAS